MHIISIKFRQKLSLILIALSFCYIAWLIEIIFLSKIVVQNTITNLPLVIVIVSGLVASKIKKSENPFLVHKLNNIELLKAQFLNGSLIGFLVGALMAILEKSVTTVFPLNYLLIGYMSGYFSLKNFNSPIILVIILVFLLSVFSQVLFACQVYYINGIYTHLVKTVLVQATLNSLISPIIFYPINSLTQIWLNTQDN